MNKQLLSILVLLVLVTSVFSQPDTLWTKTFGGIEADYGESVKQTSDGGYIITGSTYSYSVGSSDAYLIKTDVNGNEIWSQSFGGISSDYGCDVLQTSDGGYIVVGYTQSYGDGFCDVYLIKTDSNGNGLWQRALGGDGADFGISIQQTSDGGYIITGHTNSYGVGWYDVYLLKTDANGNELWHRAFGQSDYDYGCYVQQTLDGGYIIVGFQEYFSGTGTSDVYLIKTDENGNETWSQTIGGDRFEKGYYGQQTSDGGYIITGVGNFIYGYQKDVILIKTDAEGNELWTRLLGGNTTDYGNCVKQTSDGGYIITGETLSYGAGNYDVYVIKTDENGNESWSQTFGGADSDKSCSVQQTSDGGFVIAGKTKNWGAGNNDVWLIKLAADQTPVNLTLTPHNPPIQIPANGGAFGFDVNIENIGNLTVNCDIWSNITKPNGANTGNLINVNNYMLTGGSSANRAKSQNIPDIAPAGNYTYNAYIGEYPDIIWSEDHFDFEKLVADDGSGMVNNWNTWGESFDNFDSEVDLINSDFIHLNSSPNPFNPTTELTYTIPVSGEVSLTIYDIQGREVNRLLSGVQTAGSHKVKWDAGNHPSGIYFARLSSENGQTQTRKLVLMK